MNLKKNFFTLIELLIVLAIIGAVATLALDQSSEVVDQTRYDLTEQNGAEIQNAIIGDVENGGRFLRDMGRLPMVLSTDEGKVLEELWNADSAVRWSEVSLLDMNNVSSTVKWSEPERTWGTLPNNIFLSAGWRGPYLNMGARSELYDGWGNPWVVDIETYIDDNENSGSGDGFKDEVWRDNNSSSTVADATVNDVVHGVKSLGRDQALDTGSESWQNIDKTFDLPENRVFCSAAFSIKVRDNAGRSVTPKSISSYTASTAYKVGQSVVVGSDIFTVQTAGTSHSSAPSWDTTTAGTSTTNELSGSLVWLYIGVISDNPEYYQSMRVAVFVPDFSRKSTGILRVLCEWDGDNAINDDTLFTFADNATMVDDKLEAILDDNWSTLKIDGLMPGIRKFYIYGFNGDYRRGSFVQTIDLKPGSNYREVILTEEL